MKSIITILAIFFGLASVSTAQSPLIEWQKCFGGSSTDEGFSVQETSDGGYIIAGSAASNDGDLSEGNGGFDGILIKTDELGNIEWQRSFGGSGEDILRKVSETADGGYVAVGSTTVEAINGVNVEENFQAWILKVDQFGTTLWESCLGDFNDDSFHSVVGSPDGGYVAVGWHTINTHAVKFSVDGEVQWQRSYNPYGNFNVRDVKLTLDGGYIIAAHCYAMNGFLIKTDSLGITEWTTTCLGAPFSNGVIQSIVQTDEGDYLVVGHSSVTTATPGHNGSFDMWLAKVSSSGTPVWSKCFGGPGSETANHLSKTSDGGFILSGTTSMSPGNDVPGNNGGSDAFIVRLDSEAGILWTKNYGGVSVEQSQGMIETSDGGYLFVGRVYVTSNNTGDVYCEHNGNTDVWLVKMVHDMSVSVDSPDPVSEEPKSFRVFDRTGRLVRGLSLEPFVGEYGIYLFRYEDGITKKVFVTDVPAR